MKGCGLQGPAAGVWREAGVMVLTVGALPIEAGVMVLTVGLWWGL